MQEVIWASPDKRMIWVPLISNWVGDITIHPKTFHALNIVFLGWCKSLICQVLKDLQNVLGKALVGERKDDCEK